MFQRSESFADVLLCYGNFLSDNRQQEGVQLCSIGFLQLASILRIVHVYICGDIKALRWRIFPVEQAELMVAIPVVWMTEDGFQGEIKGVPSHVQLISGHDSQLEIIHFEHGEKGSSEFTDEVVPLGCFGIMDLVERTCVVSLLVPSSLGNPCSDVCADSAIAARTLQATTAAAAACTCKRYRYMQHARETRRHFRTSV